MSNDTPTWRVADDGFIVFDGAESDGIGPYSIAVGAGFDNEDSLPATVAIEALYEAVDGNIARKAALAEIDRLSELAARHPGSQYDRGLATAYREIREALLLTGEK